MFSLENSLFVDSASVSTGRNNPNSRSDCTLNTAIHKYEPVRIEASELDVITNYFFTLRDFAS